MTFPTRRPYDVNAAGSPAPGGFTPKRIRTAPEPPVFAPPTSSRCFKSSSSANFHRADDRTERDLTSTKSAVATIAAITTAANTTPPLARLVVFSLKTRFGLTLICSVSFP